VTHAVQLGVLCFSSDGGSLTYYDDLVVECADQGHFFQYWDQYGSTTSTLQFRYTCFETANFPIGSTVDQPRTIPSVAMTLDPEWLLAPFSECFQRVPKPPTLMPSQSPVTQSPVTQSPSTMAPAGIRRPSPSNTVADMPIALSLAPLNAPVALGGGSDRDSTSVNHGIVVWRVVVSVLVGAIVALALGRLCWYMVARRKSRIQTGDTAPTDDKDPQPTMPDPDGDCDLESNVSNPVTEALPCPAPTDGEAANSELRDSRPKEEVSAPEASQTEDVRPNDSPALDVSPLDVILTELETALSELEASQTPHEEVSVSESSCIENVMLNDAPALSEMPMAVISTELESAPSEMEMPPSPNEEVSESSPIEDVVATEELAQVASSSTELESAPRMEQSQTDARDTNKEMATPPSQHEEEQVTETLQHNARTESTHRSSSLSTSRDDEQANAVEQNQKVPTSDVNELEQLLITEEVTPAAAAQQDQSVTDGTITDESNEKDTRISHEADEPVQPTLGDGCTVPSSQPPLLSIRTDVCEAASTTGTDSQLAAKSPSLGSDGPAEADAIINGEHAMLSQLAPCTVVASLARGHVGESDESCHVHIEDAASKTSHSSCSTEEITTEEASQLAHVGSGPFVPEAQAAPDEIEMPDEAAREPPNSLEIVPATGAESHMQGEVKLDLSLPQLAVAPSSQPSIVPSENVQEKSDHDDPPSKEANDLAVSPLAEGNAAVTNEADGALSAREIYTFQFDGDSHHFL
jgi:hypothetical protein